MNRTTTSPTPLFHSHYTTGGPVVLQSGQPPLTAASPRALVPGHCTTCIDEGKTFVPSLTPAGSSSELNEEQPLNAESPMLVRLEGS